MPSRRAAAPPTALDSFVLHRYDWSESSLVLELFTRERGRLAAIAKGAKRPTSQLRTVLMPFQRAQVLLARTPVDENSEIQLLRQAEWTGGGPVMPAAALFQGFYLNELLLKLLARNDAHPSLFDTYVDTLPALAHGNETVAQAGLRAFELRVLLETGVLPDLSVTTLGHQDLKATQSYALRPEVGVVPVGDDGPALSGADLQALQQALEQGTTRDLQAACGSCLGALRPMLRQWLHYHLGTSSLRTREVMHSVQRLLETAPLQASEAPTAAKRPAR